MFLSHSNLKLPNNVFVKDLYVPDANEQKGYSSHARRLEKIQNRIHFVLIFFFLGSNAAGLETRIGLLFLQQTDFL